MSPLEGFLEENTIAGLTEAMSQFDILDRGAGKALGIKASNRLKGNAPDGSTSSPKGCCRWIPMLVDEMM